MPITFLDEEDKTLAAEPTTGKSRITFLDEEQPTEQPSVQQMESPKVAGVSIPPAPEPLKVEVLKPQDGMLRKAADIPIGLLAGTAGTLKSVADVFGADSPASQQFADRERFWNNLISESGKEKQKRAAEIQQAAQDKGVWEQAKAAARAFTEAPTIMLATGAGSLAPVIVAGAAAPALGGGATAVTGTQVGLGTLMGAGAVKGGIYEQVKQNALDAGKTPEEAEKLAVEAQSYGENPEQIIAGGALGALASATGIEATAGRAISGAARKLATGAQIIGKNIAEEVLTEAPQQFQQRVAQNIAAQKAGFNVPTFQGAIGEATTAGIIAAGLGGIAGGIDAVATSSENAQKVKMAVNTQSAAQQTSEITPLTSSAVIDQAEAVGRQAATDLQIEADQKITETPEQRVSRLQQEAKAAAGITLEEAPTPEIAQARITEREGQAATPVETPAGTRIEAAAYQAPDGTVYYGASHLDAMAKARDAGKIDQTAIDAKQETTSRETPEFGFATDKEAFIGRSQAEVVATGSGQMLVDKPATGLLHSNEVSLDAFAQSVAPATTAAPAETITQAFTQMGEGAVDSYYQAILQSLQERGEVPTPERRSNVGQAWERVRGKMTPKEFVVKLRQNAEDPSKIQAPEAATAAVEPTPATPVTPTAEVTPTVSPRLAVDVEALSPNAKRANRILTNTGVDPETAAFVAQQYQDEIADLGGEELRAFVLDKFEENGGMIPAQMRYSEDQEYYELAFGIGPEEAATLVENAKAQNAQMAQAELEQNKQWRRKDGQQITETQQGVAVAQPEAQAVPVTAGEVPPSPAIEGRGIPLAAPETAVTPTPAEPAAEPPTKKQGLPKYERADEKYIQGIRPSISDRLDYDPRYSDIITEAAGRKLSKEQEIEVIVEWMQRGREQGEPALWSDFGGLSMDQAYMVKPSLVSLGLIEPTKAPISPMEAIRRIARGEKAEEGIAGLVDSGFVEVYNGQPVLTQSGINALPKAERPRLTPEARKIQIDTRTSEAAAEAISKNLRIGVDQVPVDVRMPEGWTLVGDVYVPPQPQAVAPAPEVREARREPAITPQQDMASLSEVPRIMKSTIPTQKKLDTMKAGLPKYTTQTNKLSGNSYAIHVYPTEGGSYENRVSAEFDVRQINEDQRRSIGLPEGQNKIIYIVNVGAPKRLRGLGYGQALYRELAKFAQSQNISALYSSDVSPAAAAVREKLFGGDVQWSAAGDMMLSIVGRDIRYGKRTPSPIENIFDAREGIGQVPFNVEIGYRGFVKYMTPSEFRSLVPAGVSGPETKQFVVEALGRGEKLGQPFLNVEWNEADGVWEVTDHEGRSRVDAILEVYGNIPIPVHLFPRGLRAADITEKMRDASFISQADLKNWKRKETKQDVNPVAIETQQEIRALRMPSTFRAGMEPSAVESRLQELGFPTGGIIRVVNQPDADFEGRTIILDGKVTGIELNASAMRDNATIDRVLNHELAESANADGALNKLVERLTPKEKKEINDTITRLRYEERARTTEEAARAIEALAEAWKGRGFFTRAVARVEAWASKLGFKLTRRAAEYIAARNLADINSGFRTAYNRFINVKGEAREGRVFVTPEENARFLELAKDPEANREELQKMVDEKLKDVIGNRPANIVGKWQAKRESLKEGSSEWYIAEYANNDFDNERYYRTLEEAWAGSKSRAYDWAMNDDVDYSVIKKIEAAQESPPAWFKDLYWERIDPEVRDKGGILDHSVEAVRRDAQGNVIPLEQRFQPEQADIRYNPLGYDITTVVEDIKAGRTDGPLKAVNNVVKEASALRDRVKAESLRRQHPRARGKSAILERIARERSSGKISEETAQALSDFVNSIRNEAIGDTAISIRGAGGVSNFDFGQSLVSFFLTQDQPKIGARVGIHEFWHGLARFLPQKEVDQMTKDYTKALGAYLKKNPWFLAFVGRYSLTPEQFEAYKIFNPKEAETKLVPVLDREGNPVKYQIKYDADNYRYIMLDEWIAEKMTDLVRGKQAIPDTFMGKLAKIIRDFMAMIRSKLGRDAYQSFYNLVTDPNQKIDLQRMAGVARPFQIYQPQDYDYSKDISDQIRYSYAGPQAEMPQFMRDSFAAAQDMASKGEDAVTIRMATGWILNPYDKKLRWEIPDKNIKLAITKEFRKKFYEPDGWGTGDFDVVAAVRDLAKNKSKAIRDKVEKFYKDQPYRSEKKYIPLMFFINHPQLFKAYPDLAFVEASFNPDDMADWRATQMAAFMPAKNRIIISGSNLGMALSAGAYQDLSGGMRQRLLRSVMHEIQHWIQEKEGFAVGTRPQLAGFERYKRTAGEIEARDVEARIGLTESQRKYLEPYSSENIDPADAVMMGLGKGGVAASFEIRESRREPEAIPTFTEGTPEAATLKEMEASMAKVDAASEAKGGKPETYKISEIASVWMDSGLDERALQDAIVEYTNLTPANAQKVAKAINKQYGLQKQIAEAAAPLAEIAPEPEGAARKTAAQRLIEQTTGVRKAIVKVTGSEKALLNKQIQLKAREARETRKSRKEAAADLVKTIQDLVKTTGIRGPINSRQSMSLTKKALRLDVNNEDAVDRFIAYAEKVIENANYDRDLADAHALIKRSKEFSKAKTTQGNIKTILDIISLVPPSMLDNPFEFNVVVQRYLMGLSPVTSKNYAVMPDADMEAYLNSLDGEIKQNQKELDRSRMQRKLDSLSIFADERGLTVDEAMTLLESDEYIKAENLAKQKAITDLLNSLASDSQKDVKGYDSTGMTDSQKELVSFMKTINVENLTNEEKRRYVRYTNNLLANGATFGLEQFKSIAKAQNFAIEAAQDKRLSKQAAAWISPVAKWMGENTGELIRTGAKGAARFFQSEADTIKNIFGSSAVGAIRRYLGIADLDTAQTKSTKEKEKIANSVGDFYKRLKNKFGENSVNTEQQATSVVAGYLIQQEGNKTQEESIQYRRRLMQENIDDLRTSDKQSKLQEADFKAKALDALVGTTNEEILNNLKKLNPVSYEEVMWWKDKMLPEYRPFLKEHDENFRNQANNYNNPDHLSIFYKWDEESLLPTELDEVYRNDPHSMRIKQAANSIKRVDHPSLPVSKSGAKANIDGKFGYNQYSALVDQVDRAFVAPVWEQIVAFTKTPEFIPLMGGKANADLMKKILLDTQIARSKSYVDDDTSKVFLGLVSFTRRLASQRVLGGFTAPLKQVSDQLIKLISTTGRRGLVFDNFFKTKEANPLLEKFPISRRGDAKAGSAFAAEFNDLARKVSSAISNKRWSRYKELMNKMGEFWMGPLRGSDVWIAKVSWLAYYESNLNKNNIKMESWEKEAQLVDTDKARQEAAQYAEWAVDYYAGASDPSKMAKISKQSKNGALEFLKMGLIPLNSFAVQQKSAMISDLRDIFLRTEPEERKAAMAGLAGNIGGMITFHGIRIWLISALITGLGKGILQAVFGIDPEEPDEEKKDQMLKDRWRKFYASLFSNMVAGGLGGVAENQSVAAFNKVSYLWNSLIDPDSLLNDKGEVVSFREYEKKFAPLYRYQNFNRPEYSFGLADILFEQGNRTMSEVGNILNRDEMEKYSGNEYAYNLFSTAMETAYFGGFMDADLTRIARQLKQDMDKSIDQREKELKRIREGR